MSQHAGRRIVAIGSICPGYSGLTTVVISFVTMTKHLSGNPWCAFAPKVVSNG